VDIAHFETNTWAFFLNLLEGAQLAHSTVDVHVAELLFCNWLRLKPVGSWEFP
jgi:hypothetical protein